MNTLTITLAPSYCNRWPNLVITHNNLVLFDDEIADNVTLSFDVESNDVDNLFTVGLTNKHFGEDNIWDTAVDENNNIIADLKLEIIDITFADVSVKDLFLKGNYHIDSRESQSHLPSELDNYDGTMNFNGLFKFKYSLPVLNDITNQKFKVPLSKEMSYFSNYTTLFHYERDLEVIKEIEDIMDDVKKLSS